MSTADVTTVIDPSAFTRQTAAAGSRAAGPVAGCDSDALVLGERSALLPERVLTNALEHLDGSDRGERGTRDVDVALDDRVAQPQFERVELELRRELVDQRLDGERSGRRPRRSVGAERESIRLDAVSR